MARQSKPTAVPVLLTRPETEARAFAKALVGRFGERVRPLVAPLMAPHFQSPEPPEGAFAGVIFTSIRAVEGALRLGLPLPDRAYCVGRKTAAAARAAGFRAVSADGDAAALVSLILRDRPDGRLLYIRGVDTRGSVEETLNSEGVTTVSFQVYRQAPQALHAEAVTLLLAPGEVIVPLFSPRSATLFAEALPDGARASLLVAAMSPAVAEAASALPRLALAVAPQPDAEGMIEAVGTLLAVPRLP